MRAMFKGMIAALMVAGSSVAAIAPAQADRGSTAIVAGLLGLGVGAAIASDHHRGYYEEPVQYYPAPSYYGGTYAYSPAEYGGGYGYAPAYYSDRGYGYSYGGRYDRDHYRRDRHDERGYDRHDRHDGDRGDWRR